MKIIDFEKKGNVVRFYLGDDDCEDYHGDDWDDTPYECNAGKVYDEYARGFCDVVFPFDYVVLEPCDGHRNSRWCKDDMKARKVPCIVVAQPEEWYCDEFDRFVSDDNAIKFYFGDTMEPAEQIRIYQMEDKDGRNHDGEK